MKRFTISLCLAVLVGHSGLADKAAAFQKDNRTQTLINYQNEITVPFLKKHLVPFAADSMEGRETGMPGQKKAAEYLAREYESMGLKPAGDNNTYFQNFNLNATKRDSTVFRVYDIDDGKLISRSSASRKGAAELIRLFGGSDTLNAEIIFAGFGVQDSARGVDHLSGVDLSGKWVMVFEQIPHVVDEDTLINPSISSRERLFSLLRKRAAGVLLIPAIPTDAFRARAEGRLNQYGQVSNMRLKYLDRGSGGFDRGYNQISPALAARMLGLDGGLEGVEALRESLIENIRSFSPRTTGYGLKQIPYTSVVTVETENVAALLEGTDPQLKDQVVVLTSHYDHVGIGTPDSTGDAIYNGADDDGSGTVALLNVAHAFAQARKKGVGPRRSVLFLHVSGEEKGLLGSRYYSDHPLFPMEKTVANINIDMIGRIDKDHEQKGITDYAYVIGGSLISSDLDSLMRAANARSGQIVLNSRYNDLNDPNQFYRRSDHWNFGRLGVPFVFFFTGVHEDYHRPSDEVHKIRFEKMAKIVRTIYATTVELANTEVPPKVDNQTFIEATKATRR